MMKSLLAAPSILGCLFLLAAPAAAGPSWSSIGKGQLPRYGNGELYIGKLARHGDQLVSGELRAVLDQPWVNPDASGSYRDIYFRVRVNCRNGTLAVQPTWPDSPQTPTVRDGDMRRPAAGSGNDRLLKAYCR